MKVQGQLKMQTHPSSVVVMDIAAFKISHCVGFDKDATALRAVIARSSSIGALDESSRNVQKVGTPGQPDWNTRLCSSALPCPRCRVPRPASHEHT